MNAGGEEELAQAFENLRPRLLRVAYMTTGSLAEAEDCVQETWLRLRSLADPAEVRDLGAWTTTVVARLALDALGSARARRERYVGVWLPEPVVGAAGGPDAAQTDADPADRVALDESVAMALLVVLERLSPAQRTAFLLHDVFGFSFAEVASVVGRSPAAVRQLAARARRDVEEGRPRFPPTPAEQGELVGAFAAACRDGDLERLVGLLDPEVVWRGDGGAKVTASPRFLRGAERVARALLTYGEGSRAPQAVWPAEVNGVPGLILRDVQGVLSVVAFTVDAGRITAIDVIRNPDKLTTVPEPMLRGD